MKWKVLKTVHRASNNSQSSSSMVILMVLLTGGARGKAVDKSTKKYLLYSTVPSLMIGIYTACEEEVSALNMISFDIGVKSSPSKAV